MTNCLPWILALAAYALAVTALLVACRRRRHCARGMDRVDLLLAHHEDSEALLRAAEALRAEDDAEEEPC